MKLEYFIAKRLISTKNYKSSISAPIIKIAILAIAISVIMMLVSVATGIGLKQKIRQKIAAFHGHIVVSNFDNNNSEVSVTPIEKSVDFYDALKAIPEVVHTQPFAAKGGIIRTETSFEGFILKGVDKDYQWTAVSEYLISGRLPDYSKAMSNEIIISQYIANRLNLKTGDLFNAFFLREDTEKPPFSRRFKIVGIFDSGLQEFDETFIYGDIRHIQRFNRWSETQVGGFELLISDFDQIEQVGAKVYEVIPSFYDSITIEKKFPLIFEWLTLFDFNIIVIFGVMVLVAAINMIVALLVLILERTQMIGILKSLGANNWSIRKIFLYNAAYFILCGLFFGNLIGLSLLYLQQFFGIIKLDPQNYYVKEAPVYIDWFYILLINLGTIGICMLVLLVPSYLITRISPVKAMRFN